MNELLLHSTFFGVLISITSYMAGMALKRKFKLGIFNPLLISIIITMVVLLVLHIDYDTYNAGAKYLSYLLTPATVCLAIPLYEQFELLKSNWRAVLVGIFAGCMASLASVLALALLFGISHEEYVTFLPKSITTAIGMVVSEQLGGYVPITAAVIIVTGVLGNIIAPAVIKLFRIREPIAKGVATGTSAHAIGTVKAMEFGETEGAMSSLSIVVAGLITVVGASLFAGFV